MKRKLLILLGLCPALLFCGCQRSDRGAQKEIVSDPLTRSQFFILAATERNRYEQIYTDQIWQVEVPEENMDFAAHLVEQIKMFARDLDVTGQMAEDADISLDNSEKEQLRHLAQEYYSGLTDGDKAYTKATEADVRELYQKYYLASKTVQELTKDSDVEISDSEAKVITVNQIVLTDQAKAAEVYTAVCAEGADFTAIASANTTDPVIQKQLARGDSPANLETAVFSLENGEICEPVEVDGTYYIFQCTNSYDEEATQTRKNDMMLARRNEAFRQQYRTFLEAHPQSGQGEDWGEVDFTTENQTSTTNFFECYQEYFPNSGYGTLK